MAVNKTAGENQLKVNEEKWSKPVWTSGWTGLPIVLIENQRQLGLDALDVNILLHLVSRWWRAEGKPHPSKGSIAQAMNVDPRTVQRRIAAMEKAGYLRREERRESPRGSETNIYHLDGLVEALQPFAEEKLADRAEREEAAKKRAARKGAPKFTVVNGSKA